MNKIILAALKAKYGENAELIAEVVSATPYPETSAELLLGCYDEPDVPETSEYVSRNYKDYYNVKKLRYDRLSRDVTFSFSKNEAETRHFKTEELAKAYSLDGSDNGDSAYRITESHQFPGTFTKVRYGESTISLESWRRSY